MFSRTTLLHFFVSLALRASFLVVFASPLPSGNSIEVSQNYRCANIAKHSVNEDITLYILFEAYPEYEYWAAAASYEEWTSAVDKSTLYLPIWRGNEKAQFSPAPRMVKLGTAKFKNDQEKEAIINGILDWKHMTMPVTEPDTCYSRQKHAKKSVLQKFMIEYQAKYTGVVGAVVGSASILYHKEALKRLTTCSSESPDGSYSPHLITRNVGRLADLRTEKVVSTGTLYLENINVVVGCSSLKNRGARELWFFGLALEEKRSEGPRE
ncbi:hypothetical protein DFH05DRAFT_1555213 [Lentinula detonsa]|uniref:Uncharacterized protein n=1 Tax=Lentinula detonsa TaxID=2804962 RepID=A0A9W8P4T8_9AGAR|nr:hypothetical protein DFH05DRAFT_1555213 [Lentinula detonsa]